MIEEDYVSLETAKLLKEKCFDGECHMTQVYIETNHNEDSDWTTETEVTIGIPTIQVAKKWVEEKTGKFIGALTPFNDVFSGDKFFVTGVYTAFETACGTRYYRKEAFCGKTQEETQERAIKYCLENCFRK
jgi:hypothetical protein